MKIITSPLSTPILTIVLSILITGCATTKTTSTNTTTKTSTPPTPPKPRIALVLGGGGARGFAHVGVIEALEQHGIRPDLIVGTSSGAMVGSIYAAGKSPSELRRIALGASDDALLDYAPSKQGLILGDKLRTFINIHTNHAPIEQLPTRFVAVATQMHTGQMAAFDKGETGLMVQASASVPKLFIPPRIPTNTGIKYIDGGQSALVPARVAKSLGADIIISVDIMDKAKSSTHDTTKTTNKTTQTQTSITRTEHVITGQWGNQSIKFDLGKITGGKLADKSTPFGIIFDEVINQIPAKTTINLPAELPTELPTSKKGFWQLISSYTPTNTMHTDDIAASDIIIRPALADYSVFDLSERVAMMDAGRQATLMHITNIKKLQQKYDTDKKLAR